MSATFPRDFPEIEAGQWLLRQIRLSDVADLHAYLTDPAVTEQTSYRDPHPARGGAAYPLL